MTNEKGPQQRALEEPFASQLLEQTEKGGRKLTYVPVAEVVQRLNDVLGTAGWDWEVRDIHRDSLDPHWVVAWGNLKMTVDGKTSTKSGAGGVEVSRKRSDKSIVDLGDEFKGADSDAMKKAAQRFGVGIDLARTNEARAYEMKRLSDPPQRTAEGDGWESEARGKAVVADLVARIKASSEGVREEMQLWRENQVAAWPPTRVEYEAMESHFVLISSASSLGLHTSVGQEQVPETGIGPDDVNEPPFGSATESPPESDTVAAARKVADAFPGAKDVSPASADHIQSINDYLDLLKANSDNASIRAWNKWCKEKNLDKDRTKWTVPQANLALDFLEAL